MSYIDEVSSYKQLTRAWSHICKKRDVSPGIDRVSVEDFSRNYKFHLKEISGQLKNGTYKFRELIEKNIPKKSNPNKTRKIGIFTITDKIVQRSLQITLEGKKGKSPFSDIDNNVSIGFLSRQFKGDSVGVKIAVQRTKKYYKDGNRYVLTADIKDFFDVIDLEKLGIVIYERLGKDESIKYLIDQCLKPEVIRIDRYQSKKNSLPTTKESGVAQGSILSPFFSNIYLMEFDKYLETQKIPAIRYADDLVIFSVNKNKLKKNFKKTAGKLKDISERLEFHPIGTNKGPKVHKIDSGFEYLGIYMKKVYSANRWEIRPSDEKSKNQLVKIDDKLSVDTDETLYQRIFYLDKSISSWISTYQYSGCTKKAMRVIAKQIKETYEASLVNLLSIRGIISGALNQEQINFIGINTTHFLNLGKKKRLSPSTYKANSRTV